MRHRGAVRGDSRRGAPACGVRAGNIHRCGTSCQSYRPASSYLSHHHPLVLFVTPPARDCAQARLLPRARRRSLPTRRVRRIRPDHAPHSLWAWACSVGLCPPVPPLGQRGGPGPATVWPGLLLLGPVGRHDRGELLLDPVRVERLVLALLSWVVCCCRVHRDHLTGTDDERGSEAGSQALMAAALESPPISIFRGLAFSITGMRNVNTPAS
jgi:hypothetical protein